MRQEQYFRIKGQFFNLKTIQHLYISFIKRHSVTRDNVARNEFPSELFVVVNQQWARVSKVDTSYDEM